MEYSLHVSPLSRCEVLNLRVKQVLWEKEYL